MPEHLVTAAEAGWRLDVILTNYIKRSRSIIQKSIKSGVITVNDKHVTPHVSLDEGDVIVFPDLDTPEKRPEPGPAPILEVIYNDKDIAVINICFFEKTISRSNCYKRISCPCVRTASKSSRSNRSKNCSIKSTRTHGSKNSSTRRKRCDH